MWCKKRLNNKIMGPMSLDTSPQYFIMTSSSDDIPQTLHSLLSDYCTLQGLLILLSYLFYFCDLST